MSSAFLSSGIASYRRSNSARVNRSPFSSGGMAPFLSGSAGSTGWVVGVATAMGSVSQESVSFRRNLAAHFMRLGAGLAGQVAQERDVPAVAAQEDLEAEVQVRQGVERPPALEAQGVAGELDRLEGRQAV